MTSKSNEQFQIDFIGVGAPKSGSSWIAEVIKEHPEAQTSFVKEVTFFNDTPGLYQDKNDNYQKGLKWYKSQFPKKNSKVIGEVSVDYLYSPKAPKRILKHFPNTKIIISLRNPADKMYSYYWWYKNTDKTEKAKSFEDAIEENLEYIKRSKYYHQINRYFEIFPRKKIKVVLHKEIKENPVNTVQEIYNFLDIDASYTPSLLNEKVNPSRKMRSKSLSKLIDIAKYMRESRLNYIVKLLRKLGIYSILHRTYIKLNMQDYKYPPMKEQTRKKLLKKLERDINKTEELIKKDLSHWLSD